MKIVVTGGAGFIGSALVRHLIAHTDHNVLVVDKLTYAGNIASLDSVEGHPRYRFSHTDICDRSAIADLFSSFCPDAVMHLAAESHVDRSIDGPAEFIKTNVLGTYILLEAALAHWQRLGRLGIRVPGGDPVPDVVLQRLHGGVGTAADQLVGQQAEPALDLVHP